jgi:hypothetical protein
MVWLNKEVDEEILRLSGRWARVHLRGSLFT